MFLRTLYNKFGCCCINKTKNDPFLVSALKEQKGARGSGKIDRDMGQAEFVAGLCRLAHAKFKKIPSLATRLELLFSEHIKLHASFGANVLLQRTRRELILLVLLVLSGCACLICFWLVMAVDDGYRGDG